MELTAISLFISILLTEEINVGYYIRRILGIRRSKTIKILDCFPCFTFWLSLLVVAPVLYIYEVQDLRDLAFSILFTYIISKLYEHRS